MVISNTVGRFAAYSLAGGVPREIYNHLAPQAFSNSGNGLFATSALGYLDRGPQLDVVTASWGQMVDAWSGPTGKNVPYLSQWVKDSIWSSPAIGDVDGDGQAEIVVGGDCFGGKEQPCYGLGSGGFVWAFNLDGSLQWSYFVRDAVVWSSPSLIDLNHDGALDVVVGTGIFFDRAGARRILAIDGRSGQLLWDAATPGRVMGSPAVAMVNGEAWVWVVSEGGALQAWNSAGQQQWSTCIADQSCNSTLGTFGGVAIADVNNDGRLDAVVQGEQHLRVVDALTGTIETTVRSRYPEALFASYATPAVVSVNGQTRIVEVGVGDGNGNLGIDNGDDIVVTMWTTGTPLGAAPWPTFKQNMSPHQRSAAITNTVATVPGVRLPSALLPRVGFTRRRSRRQPHTCRSRQQRLRTARIVRRPRTVRVQRQLHAHQRRPQRRRRTDRQGRKVCCQLAPRRRRHSSPTTSAPSAATPSPCRPQRRTRPQGRHPHRPRRRTHPTSGRLCFQYRVRPATQPSSTSHPSKPTTTVTDCSCRPTSRYRSRPTSTTRPAASTPTSPSHRSGATDKSASSTHRSPRSNSSPTTSAPSTGNAYVPAVPSGAPDRKVDTRIGLGGGRIPPSGLTVLPRSGSPGDAAVVNLTPVGSGQQRFRTARFIRRDRAVCAERELHVDQLSTPTSRSHRSAGTDRSAS